MARGRARAVEALPLRRLQRIGRTVDGQVGDGAQIAQVQPGGPAADAGLQAGDVVTAVGDRAITTSTELTAAVRSASPGDQVTLTVRRGDSTSTVDVTLGSAAS